MALALTGPGNIIGSLACGVLGGRYPKNLWAAHGYVVYVLQPSGATGFGQEFSAMHVNDWGKVVSGETIFGRKVIVKHIKVIDNFDSGQMLFITSNMKKRFPKILDAVKGRTILTVGELDNFCDQGGMIPLFRQGKRIKIDNIQAAKKVGLRIDSKLLSIARIVNID